MKKVAVFLISVVMLLALAACGGQTPSQPETPPSTPAAPATPAPAPTPEPAPAPEPVELIVFAAASMTETMEQIATLYKAAAPNVTLVYNFDSSGTLKTQIQEGADCDIFISAAQRQMNELDITSSSNPDGLDFVLSGTRFNLVENKVVLAVPEGNPKGVTSFEDVAGDKVSLVALGNADVPVGQYSEELFTNMGVWDEIQGKITFGSNVKEVTTWVSSNAADCGVVYGTDAYSAGLEVVAEASQDLLSTRVIYPAAALNITSNEQAAKDFLAFLTTDACAEVFQSVGFAIP